MEHAYAVMYELLSARLGIQETDGFAVRVLGCESTIRRASAVCVKHRTCRTSEDSISRVRLHGSAMDIVIRTFAMGYSVSGPLARECLPHDGRHMTTAEARVSLEPRPMFGRF